MFYLHKHHRQVDTISRMPQNDCIFLAENFWGKSRVNIETSKAYG